MTGIVAVTVSVALSITATSPLGKVKTGKPHLWSRNGLALEGKFPAIANAVAKLKLRSTVLDGELVAVDENGIPRFQLLQRFQKQPTAPTLYYVFDVLWYQGGDLTEKPILERRKVLERILKPAAGIQIGSYVEGEGKLPRFLPRFRLLRRVGSCPRAGPWRR